MKSNDFFDHFQAIVIGLAKVSAIMAENRPEHRSYSAPREADNPVQGIKRTEGEPTDQSTFTNPFHFYQSKKHTDHEEEALNNELNALQNTELRSKANFTVLSEKKIPVSPISRATILGSTAISIASSYALRNLSSMLFPSKDNNKNNHELNLAQINSNSQLTMEPTLDQMRNKVFLLSESDSEKMVQALCKMRGAALKLGQIISMQEEKLVPAFIRSAMERARNFAHIMPLSQLENTMAKNLGKDWRSHFSVFEEKPFAAASIGQVHRGTLVTGEKVAIKVQYPGVADSVDSDLDSLKTLIEYFNLLPKSFFLDQFIANTRAELKEECDYEIEASKQIKYAELIKDEGLDALYKVPKIFGHLTNKHIMVSEFVEGNTIDQVADNAGQAVRDYAGKLIMKNTIEELFLFNFMQTDPNFSNYFFNAETKQLVLIDFGAAHHYSKGFCDHYFDVIDAAARKDRATAIDVSKKLGFLTEEETRAMLDAHCNSLFAVAAPFSFDGKFDFGSHDVTSVVYQHMPTMMKNRLKAPPPEVYSLHRKLSGAYLLNMKLKARVNVKQLFEEVRSRMEGQKQTIRITVKTPK
jgi:predicted unusual protein kinase regulating ubiquinone biosynthesis (AarF/ABC1/UbiB family)